MLTTNESALQVRNVLTTKLYQQWKAAGTISKHTIQSMGDNQATTQHQLILTWENYLAVGNLIWRGVYLKLEKFYLKFQCEHSVTSIS